MDNILIYERMKVMKKFTAYFCAFACATSLLVPVTGAKAATSNSTSVVSTANITTTEETLEIPVFSKSSSSNYLTRQGEIDATGTVSYTLNVQKPIYFVGSVESQLNSGGIRYALTNAAGTEVSLAYTSSSSGYNTDNFTKKYIPAGQYTLTITSSSNSIGGYAFAVFGYDASTSGTIKAGTSYIGYNNSTDVYKKIKVTKDGCLAVCATSFSISSSGNTTSYGNSITLCNSKKKAISNKGYTPSNLNYTNYYGVKKGTYYIKLSTPGYYNIQAKMVRKATPVATKKTAAKKVTSSNKYYTLPASTSKSSAWFKFTINKPKKLTLTTSFTGDYSTRMTVYKGSKVVYTCSLYDGSKRTLKYQTLAGKETTWPKGTYYVKISKSNKTDNGLLGIKLK